ncbi:hypothetical protein AAFF_G00123670 [Aldrovandia affinis]|uniref:5-hydroxytryptamine receptor 3A-like n=1 Tax=Aldrovandia affinis TaxID=143900 RepID=A0AAD7RRP4_9TELE|nr:hypothetical protein AAFF_G00123670 [Aldrovandia affinis]
MKTLWLACLLALAGEVSPLEVCRYQDILDYLNLTRNNEIFTSTRPGTDWRRPTVVHLDMYLYAILQVIEKTQTFTPFIWVYLRWNNELVSWNPGEFCGISQVAVPTEFLWRPDLGIMEHIEEMDKIFMMPYLHISHHGMVTLEDGFRVISTCKMDVYKFPFDTQSCDITFISGIYTDRDLRLQPSSNSSWLTRGSLRFLQKQGEWDFVNITVAREKISLIGLQWDSLKYTITIKRRPLLIVMHFLLPILFFLIMDLSSFLISDTGGEKLGFKVTVLLAISVLLLILNDILPSTSDQTPLIAMYCIVIFAFMLMSVLETILVKYLLDRDTIAQPSPNDDRIFQQEAGRGKSSFACVCSPGGAATCEQACPREGVTEYQVLWLIVQELRTLRGNYSTHTMGWGETRPRKWARIAGRINVAFFFLYFFSVCLFLLLLFLEWTA